MRIPRCSRLSILGLAFFSCSLGLLSPDRSARAALGDDVAQVAKDQARMRASLQILRRPRFDVHELSIPTGTTVRQFANGGGKVFAVSWSGAFRPNLRDVMGAHYDRFIDATRGRRMVRGPVRIELPGMVVIMAGHQRAFFGLVYLTDQLPAGVLPEELR